ncbi:MAG: MFS transporter [Bacteroidaceae bacterium]|nr:MFS transporter [Bacteroidaceae bacterium]
MVKNNAMNKSHWSWIPSLYFAEGIPYVIVMNIALVLYNNLGMSNAEVAFYTSWLYLPWVIKPLWSPIVDIYHKKRWWILSMQLLVAVSLAGVALTLNVSNYVFWTLAFFWVMAFSSATHDIAADGFYLLALNEQEQSFYVGIRSTFYRISTIFAQGGLLLLVGFIQSYFALDATSSWQATFVFASLLFVGLYLYHHKSLPKPSADQTVLLKASSALEGFLKTFVSFFQKPQILVGLAFLLLYRLPEALLVKICPLFFLAPVNEGGLGMDKGELGTIQGAVGVVGLLLGGILGGLAVSKSSFKKWLWPMVIAISLPDVVYILLAYYQPSNLLLIALGVFVEQLGYGFGFTAYMLYMMHLARGNQQTAHYAICTGFMALSMMLPGFFAGWLQEILGYVGFFTLATALTALTFLAGYLIRKHIN